MQELPSVALMVADPNPNVTSQALTALDWIGASVAGAAVAGLALFPTSGFRAMFLDLGSSDGLPLLTRVALIPGFTPTLALPAALSLVLGLRPRAPLRARRMRIVAAFGLGCVGFALCVVAMYLPIFSLAGKIKAD